MERVRPTFYFWLSYGRTHRCVRRSTRRERKNNRERERREEVNTAFSSLIDLLGLPQSIKADKVTILNSSMAEINRLRKEITDLRACLGTGAAGAAALRGASDGGCGAMLAIGVDSTPKPSSCENSSAP